jgi:hypothetical protein
MVHVVADLGRLADHHAHAVVDEHAPADGGAGVDLDAGQPACHVRREAARPAPAPHPEGVRKPMQHQCMQAGVAGQHLPGRARCGVALADAGDVFTQAAEHGALSDQVAASV